MEKPSTYLKTASGWGMLARENAWPQCNYIINCRLEEKAMSVEHVPVPCNCHKMPFGIICLMVGSIYPLSFMAHQSPFDFPLHRFSERFWQIFSTRPV